MTELVPVVVLAVVGWLVAPHTWSGSRRVAAALPLGAALHVTIELLLFAAAPSVATPRASLAVAGVLAAVVAARTGTAARTGDVGRVAVAAVVAVVVTAITVTVPVVNVTADSFRYLTVASLLAEGGRADAAGSWFLFQSRGLGTAALHGLAGPDPGYLRSLGPLMALSVVALVWDAVRVEAAGVGRRLATAVATVVALLLVTNHFFVFTALYLNGHGPMAAWFLLLAVVVWDTVRRPDAAAATSAWAAVALVSALTVTRPEGALLVVVALVPAVVDVRVPRPWRRTVLAGTGSSVLVWHGAVLARRATAAGDGLRLEIAGLAALGAVVVLAACTLSLLDRLVAARPLPHRDPTQHLLVLLCAGTVALAALSPGLVLTSVRATVRNTTSDGLWGSSLWVLAVAVVVGAAIVAIDEEQALLFPLASFVPLGLLLALLRGGAWRIGPGDSLNRMIVHVLPLAVLVVGAFVGGRVRARWAPRTEKGSAVASGAPEP